MPLTLPAALRDLGKRRINRVPSPVLAWSVPWLLVMFGSLSPLLPLVASAPVVPPMGFLFLIAWLQLRPGLFPVWAGLPLGLFDDLFSGQPFGSAVLIWSIAVIVVDFVETRFPWRGFAQDWLLAAAAFAACLVGGLVLANMAGASSGLLTIVPQLIVSIFAYPLAARLVGALDRFRLIPIREL